MIEVKNLIKQYGDHFAVDNISFKIEKGHIYGFLGPNGAGKSTTMNIMTGYLAASYGDVIINGHNILDEPEEAKKAIGYLPEQPPLYMDMTVKEYLKVAADLKKVPRAERAGQVIKVMQMTKIEHMKDRVIRNLSKGYKQRVGLAQAIIGFPETIILDEPTVGLDPKQVIEFRKLIKDLANEHTIILSSHILSEVSEVCDHLMIINNGKLVANGTPEELSQQANERHVLSITVKGAKKEIDAVMKATLPKAQYSVYESAESGCLDLEVQLEKKENPREQLFYAFAEARLPITAMNSEVKSLEDVFLSLTGIGFKERKGLKA